jgi:hypothetical protein
VKIAGVYWIVVMLAFLGMQISGFDVIGVGGILVAALTLPCSLLAIALGNSNGVPESILRMLHPRLEPLSPFPFSAVA